MRLLVPVDFSPSSERVVAEIEARPWPRATEAMILNFVDPVGLGSGVIDVGTVLETERDEARQLVEAITGRLSAGGVKASGDVIVGGPRSGIPAYAKDWKADFIILGSHGHTGLVTFLLGSVAKSALRSAECSVEIVRATPRQGSRQGYTILLATDGSEYSRAAVNSVANRPWPTGSEIKAVSVAELPPFCLRPLAKPGQDSTLDEIREDIEGSAEEAVESALAILKAAGLDAVGVELVGDPRTGILNEAGKWGADIVVVGSHGTKETRGVSPGSVAETVALHAHCSVEVIRTAE